MRQIFCFLAVTALANPAAAQDDGPSLMERGAQLFFEGLLEEMAPAIDGMAELMEEAGPALESFVTEMGPKLRAVLEEVEDWSAYEAPEVLPNGDIIIRRKPDAPLPDAPERDAPQQDMPQIEL
ncbi:hypothetical protein KDD17_03290 [Sulfitobacter albidus]|uniref:AAA+ family ATPase n=1 Tax=Sulfitobacter albidus TaxID=2829501 RepID=A0A975JEL1_9RHOB|nr:hypothetical protein [Sulfitobacter albidus]QUJ77069.1 hypothetical protein KDD17_03290 [Sulfitobacter albidus]